MSQNHQMPGQVVMMTLAGFGVCTQCGAEIADGALIGYWYSGTGRSFDKIISCPKCRRPTALLKERQWLIDQLTHLRSPRGQYTSNGASVQQRMSPDEAGRLAIYLETELDGNWGKINTVLLRLLQKLPKCEECSEYATHQIRNGPFFCEPHSGEHPTAQKLEWCDELSELGAGAN